MKTCLKCNAQVPNEVNFCPVCGASTAQARRHCRFCGGNTTTSQNFCPNCGASQHDTANGPVYQGQVKGTPQRSKLVAGLLGVFLGSFGVHNFYLGKIGLGFAQLAVTIVTCGAGALWGFIEGILLLCDRITVDGDGNPLAP